MTNESITIRCRNCGNTKKEHGVRKPYACPTRLKDTSWEPWATDAYKAAQEAGKAAAAPAQEPARELDLTPNFSAMFNQFAKDAANAGEYLAASLCVAQFASGNYQESPEAYARRAAVLRAVQAFLAPATI